MKRCHKSCGGWFFRICKKYTEYPETKKICKHTRKEHLTPNFSGVIKSTHACYKKTGRMKKAFFYCIVEYYPAKGAMKTAAWSLNPQEAYGESPKEVINSLKMMLKDAKRYKVLNDTKRPWKPNV